MIENVGVQGAASSIITVTAAEMLASLNTPGTTTFIEHGIKLLLVNDGSHVNGIAHSDIFWQNISSSSSAQSDLHTDGIIGFATHLLAGISGTIVGAYVGSVLGLTVGAIVGSVIGPVGTVEGAAIGAKVGNYLGGAIGAELASSQATNYGQEGGAAYDPSLATPPSAGWF